MQLRREKDQIRREIDEGLSEHAWNRRIAKCGTLTDWPDSLPLDLSKRCVSPRLSADEKVPTLH
jgi:hypothetical protein